MFEVGKKYQLKSLGASGAIWDCVCAGMKVFILQAGHKEKAAYDFEFKDYKEIKPKRVYDKWVNIYSNTRDETIWPTKALADRYASSHRIACIHVRQEYEEGEGLNAQD